MTAADEREARYIEAVSLGYCDGVECDECVEGARAAIRVADAEQAELLSSITFWRRRAYEYQRNWNSLRSLYGAEGE